MKSSHVSIGRTAAIDEWTMKSFVLTLCLEDKIAPWNFPCTGLIEVDFKLYCIVFNCLSNNCIIRAVAVKINTRKREIKKG